MKLPATLIRKTPAFTGSALRFAALFTLTTSACLFAKLSPVNLGTAGNFVVLSKTGVTDVPPAKITGNVGASPISGSATGLTCAEVTGTITSVDAAGPAPCNLIAPVALTQGALEIASTGQLAAFPIGGNKPAAAGEYVVIYASGLRAVSNQPVTGAPGLASPLSLTSATPTITIDGIAAKMTFSGLAPGFVGLYQVNALMPSGVTPGVATSLILSIGGVQSNSVTIATQ